MVKHWCITLSILILFGCSNNNTETSVPINTTKAKIDSFFPVTSFIKGQIIILDSLPITPLQITTIKQQKDSQWLTKNQLRQSILPFLDPVITEVNFTPYFKETRFTDQTINAVTFTYDPQNSLPDSVSLQHWDVYVDPETGKIIKVYIVKKIKENNQFLTQQLTWQTGKLAKISTILNKPDGNLVLLKEVLFIWDF